MWVLESGGVSGSDEKRGERKVLESHASSIPPILQGISIE